MSNRIGDPLGSKRAPTSAEPPETPPAAPPPQGRKAERDFHGETRRNDTHASTTDPDCRLYRKSKGQGAQLCVIGHALMENRNALIVDACVTKADGHAERIAALHMIEPRADRPHRISLGANKVCDCEDFVNELRSMNVTPHVTAKAKHSALDARTTGRASYRVSQIIRKRIEEPFGWIKSAGGFAKTKLRGLAKVGWQFILNAAAHNAIRLPKLLAGAG